MIYNDLGSSRNSINYSVRLKWYVYDFFINVNYKKVRIIGFII